MSLFGNEDERDEGSSGLFGDEVTGKSQKGGLFGDDADPWMPTPKKRKDLSQILENSDIPDGYIELFDNHAHKNLLPLTGLRNIMDKAQLTEHDKESIVSIVVPSDSIQAGLSRGLSHVAFMLMALAQQGEEISIDMVDNRKAGLLIVPRLSTSTKSPSSTNGDNVSAKAHSHGHSNAAHTTSDTSAQSDLDVPTTKTISQSSFISRSDRDKGDLGDPWDAHNNSQQKSTEQPGAPLVVHERLVPSDAGSGVDPVTVRALDGKEGLPLWKHINYELNSAKRKSSVVRRYSDFAWLLECLLKQYPFRQIPLLPPKRLAVNGVHIHLGKQADLSFLEKRRRGLSRFVNALERHPVLRSDQLVTTFLTIPTELAVWRKQASITIKEEFADRYLSPDLEGSLPQGISEWMTKTIEPLRSAIDTFNNLTTLQERLLKRQEATSTDLLRFSLSINTFCEQERQEHTIFGKDNGPGITIGLQAVSKHHSLAHQLYEKECRNAEDNQLEDLKRHRDTLIAMSEVFVRHAKYSGDNIPSLEKRIATAQQKLASLNAKVDAKESDKSKLSVSIKNDEAAIRRFEDRKIFIRECVWHELQYFEAQQVYLSKLVNEMAVARNQFAKKHAEISAAFVGDVEGMP